MCVAVSGFIRLSQRDYASNRGARDVRNVNAPWDLGRCRRLGRLDRRGGLGGTRCGDAQCPTHARSRRRPGGRVSNVARIPRSQRFLPLAGRGGEAGPGSGAQDRRGLLSRRRAADGPQCRVAWRDGRDARRPVEGRGHDGGWLAGPGRFQPCAAGIGQYGTGSPRTLSRRGYPR